MKISENKLYLDEVYEDMKKQFPKAELVKKSYLQHLLNTNFYKLFVFFEDNELIGYSFCFIEDFIFIDYIAVVKSKQSKGYGGQILQILFNNYKNFSGFLFEVEKIDETVPFTIKRQNFYKKLGCKKLDFIYYFPNDIKLLPMDLFYFYLNKNKDLSKLEIFRKVCTITKKLRNNVKSQEDILEKIKKENGLVNLI